jgi:serine/threonine protein kinase
MMTGVGVLLGTAAYMSPEQAKGRQADKRSDIWAFGCVFYETLTGKRAFEGEDVTETIAAVIRGDPNWNALPSAVPGQVQLLIRRCLAKDRRDRIGDMSTARFLLTETLPLAAASKSFPGVLGRPILRTSIAVVAGAVVASTRL